MANYLEKRRKRWHAVMDVPKAARAKIGKRRFVQSLKTESYSQAARLVLPVVARWKQQIADASGQDELTSEALLYRDILRKEQDPEQQELINGFIWDRFDALWQKGAPKGELDAAEARAKSTTLDRAQKFASIAWGLSLPIDQHFEEWLAETDVAEKTLGDHRRAIQHLLKYHTTVEEIDRKTASHFTRKVLAPNLGAATVNRRLNTYRRYWKWLADRGFIPEDKRNPWRGQSLKVKGKGKRRAFTENEGAALLEGLEKRGNKYPDDAAIARLMAVTGMRAEEAASLRPENLEFGEGVVWISIRGGKTAAAERTIPVIEPTVVADLKKRMADGEFLFEEVGSSVNENGRANAYKKRATRVLDKINPSPKVVANHSWRYRAIKLLELAGTERHIANYFVGHAQKGESLSRYFTGPNRTKLVEAAKNLQLPIAGGDHERSAK